MTDRPYYAAYRGFVPAKAWLSVGLPVGGLAVKIGSDHTIGSSARILLMALVIVLPVLVVAVWVMRNATTTSREGVTVRKPFRTTRISWTDVREIRVIEVKGGAGTPSHTVMVYDRADHGTLLPRFNTKDLAAHGRVLEDEAGALRETWELLRGKDLAPDPSETTFGSARIRRRTVLVAGLGAAAAAVAIPAAVILSSSSSHHDTSTPLPSGTALPSHAALPALSARTVLTGHPGGVMSVAFSPDGKTLATGSSDRTVWLWDVATGRTTASLNGHTDFISSVAFSPDGKTLATATDHTVLLQDMATGQATTSLNGGASPVAFSPDGKTLATSSSDSRIRLWNVASGTHIATLGTYGVESVAFSPDGKTLATGAAGATDLTAPLQLWAVASGSSTTTLTGHTGPVASVAFSPDGKTLATGSSDRTVRLWDVARSSSTATLTGHTIGVHSVAFSPDGKTLATGSANTVLLWDVATGRATTSLNDGASPVAFSPDGKTLATGGTDNTARLWKVP